MIWYKNELLPYQHNHGVQPSELRDNRTSGLVPPRDFTCQRLTGHVLLVGWMLPNAERETMVLELPNLLPAS